MICNLGDPVSLRHPVPTQCKYIHAYPFMIPPTETPMGWLRLVGSLKIYVSFAKEPYKRDDILKKRHIILRSLLIVATPYLHNVNTCMHTHLWIHLQKHLPTQLCLCTHSQSYLGWHFQKALSKLKARSSKLERLFSLKRGKRDVRAWSLNFERAFRKCHPKWDRLYMLSCMYGVAKMSRLLKIIGLFCRISSFL